MSYRSVVLSIIFFVVILNNKLAGQNIKTSILNDTTEIQLFENGKQLKVQYRIRDGTILTIAKKNELLENYKNIKQEFNIKYLEKDTIGEVFFILSDKGYSNSISINKMNDTLFRQIDIESNNINMLFPEFRWAALNNGEIISSEKLKGKVVVLNFWHTSCIPCIAEMPLLNDLAGRYLNKDVLFIASTPNSKQELIEFLKKKEFKYEQSYLVQPETIFKPMPGWPIHVILDKAGKIKLLLLGKQKGIEERLIKGIEAALEDN